MKILLISGAPNTGKTKITTMIESYLRTIGFRNSCRKYVIPENDSAVVLEGINKKGKNIRILLNTASDTQNIINQVHEYYQQNSPIDCLITTVRDMHEERDYLFNTFEVENNEYLEIPLAKVTRRNGFDSAIEDYQSRILLLVQHVLSLSPFNIS